MIILFCPPQRRAGALWSGIKESGGSVEKGIELCLRLPLQCPLPASVFLETGQKYLPAWCVSIVARQGGPRGSYESARRAACVQPAASVRIRRVCCALLSWRDSCREA